MLNRNTLASLAAVLGLAAVGVIAMPHDAKAWWRGGWGCCAVGFVVPPIVVAPPVVVAAPPPVYYAPARRYWVPAHWEGQYWVRGHWG